VENAIAVALLGGFPEVADRLLDIPLHAHPMEVHVPKQGLGVRVVCKEWEKRGGALG
jgi:hypothetical protein